MRKALRHPGWPIQGQRLRDSGKKDNILLPSRLKKHFGAKRASICFFASKQQKLLDAATNLHYALVMKITVELDDGCENPFVTAEDGKGPGRSFARVCLKTLVVLKSKGFSGSELMHIENLVRPLQKAVELLPLRP